MIGLMQCKQRSRESRSTMHLFLPMYPVELKCPYYVSDEVNKLVLFFKNPFLEYLELTIACHSFSAVRHENQVEETLQRNTACYDAILIQSRRSHPVEWRVANPLVVMRAIHHFVFDD